MTQIVVTGGIATGKSAFLERLSALQPEMGLFDCDRAVHQLLTELEVLAKLRERFGDSVFEGEDLNRAALRQLVFSDESRRRELEALLHPLVRRRYETYAAAYAASDPEGLCVADVPLYFETNGSYPNDMVAVVATTRNTQETRLIRRSGFAREEACAIIDAQLPIDEKVRRADVLIWNEGPMDRLADQAHLFLRLFPDF